VKRCSTCKLDKPKLEFCGRKVSPDGLNYRCRACSSEIGKKHYALNATVVGARTKKWRKEHPERFAATQRDWVLRTKFGITLLKYNEMLASQGGLCRGCSAPSSAKGTLHVDHDHKTGRVRGLLCVACNTAIGLLQDDPSLCRRMADYLEST